jgi:hypothetical protein
MTARVWPISHLRLSRFGASVLIFAVLLFSLQLALGQFTQQGSKLVGSGAIGDAQQGTSVALSGDGNTAIVGGPNDNSSAGNNSGAGAAWVFTQSGSVWTQQGSKLVGTGAVGNAQQGTSVALSADGNTAIVRGPKDNASAAINSGAGAAWVFSRNASGGWTQQGSKLVGTGAAGSAQQGMSVALSADGNTAIVGGPGDNSHAGAAWVFLPVAAGSGPSRAASWSALAELERHRAGPSHCPMTATPLSSVGSATTPTPAQCGSSPEAAASSVALSDNANTAIVGGHGDRRHLRI